MWQHQELSDKGNEYVLKNCSEAVCQVVLTVNPNDTKCGSNCYTQACLG